MPRKRNRPPTVECERDTDTIKFYDSDAKVGWLESAAVWRRTRTRATIRTPYKPRALVLKFDEAAQAYAFKGAQHQSDYQQIEFDYWFFKNALLTLVRTQSGKRPSQWQNEFADKIYTPRTLFAVIVARAKGRTPYGNVTHVPED